jgi:glycerophosphoryl diester phosphodiesterase
MPEFIYGHRGARAHLPENTLQAFEAALKGGANAIETDVHVTSDGQVVVFHDTTGERIAGTSKSIASVTWKEARSWDVGYQHVAQDGSRPFVGNEYRMPLLESLIQAYPSIRLNVDIKPGAKAVQAVVDVVRRFGEPSNILLTSFDDHARKKLQAIQYQGPIGLGYRECIRALLLPRQLMSGRWREGTRIQVPPAFGPFTLGNRRFISKAHAMGLKVDFWTINNAQQARVLVEYGADGIMSDDPALIATELSQDT